MRIIREGQIVRHFKGNLYLILAIATNTETEKREVVYKALYGTGKVWCRDFDIFTSEVPKDKKNPTGQIWRFEQYQSKDISKYEIGD